jgi:phage terminase small subunit
MGRPSYSLVDRQFVDEYLARGGAGAMGAGTEAYMATHPKCSKKVAAQKSCEWLSKPIIRKYLNEAMLERQERTQITADKILQELLLIARSDISGAFNKDGSLKPIHDIPEEVRRAISGVETLDLLVGTKKVGKTHKLKFWDKVAALGLLGKNLKLFTDQVNISGTIKTVRISSNVDVGGGDE